MRKSLFAVTVWCAFGLLAQAGQAPQAGKTASSSAAKAPAGGSGVPAAINTIDPEHIRADVKFLASDYLEGRGIGQRGGDLAAEYIATQFQIIGLQPAGDDGSYLQKVPMAGVTTQESTSFAIEPLHGEPFRLRLRDEFVTSNQTLQPVSDVDGEIVFGGYGIQAPEFNWDDYKGTDVRGKVLLLLVNEPPSDDPAFFQGKALTYYGRWTYKYEEAARRGAAAVLLVHKTDMASYGWEVVRNSWGGETSYLRDDKAPKLASAGWVQLEVARRIVDAAGANLDDLMQKANRRDFRPVPLGVKLKAHIASKVREFESANVVGKLEGSDPALRHQAVLYSAHYDHFGIGPMVNGQNIYHGADRGLERLEEARRRRVSGGRGYR